MEQPNWQGLSPSSRPHRGVIQEPFRLTGRSSHPAGRPTGLRSWQCDANISELLPAAVPPAGKVYIDRRAGAVTQSACSAALGVQSRGRFPDGPAKGTDPMLTLLTDPAGLAGLSLIYTAGVISGVLLTRKISLWFRWPDRLR
jgi:hypothetical protein